MKYLSKTGIYWIKKYEYHLEKAGKSLSNLGKMKMHPLRNFKLRNGDTICLQDLF